MDSEFVERRDGSFYLVGSRVPLGHLVQEYQRGESPEAIRSHYPTLSLEQLYGASVLALGGKGCTRPYRREPTTLRLTVHPLVAASHCKTQESDAPKASFPVDWEDSGGTLRDIESRSRQADSLGDLTGLCMQSARGVFQIVSAKFPPTFMARLFPSA
jgi:hypothetical protein